MAKDSNAKTISGEEKIQLFEHVRVRSAAELTVAAGELALVDRAERLDRHKSWLGGTPCRVRFQPRPLALAVLSQPNHGNEASANVRSICVARAAARDRSASSSVRRAHARLIHPASGHARPPGRPPIHPLYYSTRSSMVSWTACSTLESD